MTNNNSSIIILLQQVATNLRQNAKNYFLQKEIKVLKLNTLFFPQKNYYFKEIIINIENICKNQVFKTKMLKKCNKNATK